MIHPSAGHVTGLGSPCTPMTKLYRCTRLDGHVTSSTRCTSCTALFSERPKVGVKHQKRGCTRKRMIGSRVYSARVPLLLAFLKHIARPLSRIMKACFDVETPRSYSHSGQNTLSQAKKASKAPSCFNLVHGV